MKDKDKEAFEKWHDENIAKPPTLNELINKAWIDACEYKQAELAHLIFKIEAENARLRECVEFYAEPWERGELDGELLVRKLESYDSFVEVHYKARQCLKELDEKL